MNENIAEVVLPVNHLWGIAEVEKKQEIIADVRSKGGSFSEFFTGTKEEKEYVAGRIGARALMLLQGRPDRDIEESEKLAEDISRRCLDILSSNEGNLFAFRAIFYDPGNWKIFEEEHYTSLNPHIFQIA